MDLFKGTKIYSIVTGTCPVCQEESMYVENNPYKLSSIFKMHERCKNCGLKYVIEPSFFFGAMYVNYGLNVGIAIITFLISYLIVGLSVLESFFALIGMLIILIPVALRLSRNIWINIFKKYNKNAKQV